MTELPTVDAHPEIPTGHYCYSHDEEGRFKCCPHWHRTENGARCDLINEEHYEKCMWHLVWDQVKECGIKLYEEGDGPYRNPDRPEGVEEVITCDCGRQVRAIRVTNRKKRKEEHADEQSVERTPLPPGTGADESAEDPGADS